MGPEVTDQTIANKIDTTTSVEKNQLFQTIQQVIASAPAVDMDKVEAIKHEIATKQLDILGDEAQRLASAERIAKQIIDEVSNVELDNR